MQGERDERLPASGGRREDDVVPGDELEESLLLRRVELEPQRANVPEEKVEQLVRGASGTRRKAIGERRDFGGDHRGQQP
jgi:hypothetical protein